MIAGTVAPAPSCACIPPSEPAHENPFGQGYAIVDPTTPERVARDARTARQRGLVQLCTTVDAWAPEAKQNDLGRKCLEAILAQPGWTVRILTKNAAVQKDFDLIAQHQPRVLIGLSLTAPPDKTEIIKSVEPSASTIPERMAALEHAHRLGLRTYGMYCPCRRGLPMRPRLSSRCSSSGCGVGWKKSLSNR